MKLVTGTQSCTKNLCAVILTVAVKCVETETFPLQSKSCAFWNVLVAAVRHTFTLKASSPRSCVFCDTVGVSWLWVCDPAFWVYVWDLWFFSLLRIIRFEFTYMFLSHVCVQSPSMSLSCSLVRLLVFHPRLLSLLPFCFLPWPLRQPCVSWFLVFCLLPSLVYRYLRF